MSAESEPVEQTTLRRALLLTWGFLGLCLAVPLLILQATSTSLAILPGWWVPIIFMVWSGAHIALLIARGRARLPEFSTWLFVYVFLGLAPALQLRTTTFPATTPDVPFALIDKALAVILISLLCMEIGLWWARHAVSEGPTAPPIISEQRAVLLAYVGLILAAYFVSKVGLSVLFSTRAELGQQRRLLWPDTTTAAIIQVAAYVPLLVAVHALVRVRRAAKATGGVARRNPLLTCICLVMLLVVINPLSSPRFVFGTVALSLVFLAGAFRTPTRVRISLTGITVALVLVFPYSDVFRTPTGGSNQSGLAANLAVNGDYDAFAQMVNTVSFVETRGATQGRQALGVVLFWVPRSTWPTKPTDTGILLANYKEYRFTNLSAPIWSEMYINAGWPAAIAGSVLLGFFLGRGGQRIAYHDRNNTPAAIGLGIVSFYLLILLRGSLLQAMANLFVLVLCTLFLRERGRQSAPSAASAVSENAAPVAIAAQPSGSR